jgi:hypothetical protein
VKLFFGILSEIFLKSISTEEKVRSLL